LWRKFNFLYLELSTKVFERLDDVCVGAVESADGWSIGSLTAAILVLSSVICGAAISFVGWPDGSVRSQETIDW
jgi:hypothetical protein